MIESVAKRNNEKRTAPSVAPQVAHISRKVDAMASNLLELRRAAGYKNANDFPEAHGIPASPYAP